MQADFDQSPSLQWELQQWMIKRLAKKLTASGIAEYY